jgi:hypothetical protein
VNAILFDTRSNINSNRVFVLSSDVYVFCGGPGPTIGARPRAENFRENVFFKKNLAKIFLQEYVLMILQQPLIMAN